MRRNVSTLVNTAAVATTSSNVGAQPSPVTKGFQYSPGLQGDAREQVAQIPIEPAIGAGPPIRAGSSFAVRSCTSIVAATQPHYRQSSRSIAADMATAPGFAGLADVVETLIADPARASS